MPTTSPQSRANAQVRWIPALILAILLSAGTLTAIPQSHAQQSESSASEDARLRNATADRLARSAILTLRTTRPSMPVDYQLCAEQLRVALMLDPNNPFMLRAMREALYHAGDMEGFNEATRQLSALEPEDTVLQLAVISARITSIQNADERLAAFARLLGPAGDSLDDSVRSRLAFDAAILAQEQGSTENFVRWLTLATQLDSTNKQAAARAADYFLAGMTDPRGRVEILANVLLADPLDPSAHLNLAREFLDHGATHAGERFLTHAMTLWQQEGYRTDEGTLLSKYALEWLHTGGPKVLEGLDELEILRRYIIDQQRLAAEEAGDDPALIEVYKPNPVSERVRLTIASAEGMDELAESAMLKIETSIREIILDMRESLSDEDPPDEEFVNRNVIDLMIESLYLRLWSGVQIEKADATIDQLVKMQSIRALKPEAIERFRGWIAAHNGEFEKAERLLAPTADEEPFAMLGLGVASEQIDDRRGAIKAYAQVALQEPGTLMGVWARRRLEILLGQSLTTTPVSQELEALAESLPDTLDNMIEGPGSYLVFNSEIVSPSIDRLGRILVRLSVRNVSTIPVAVGERAAVRTSALLIPRLVVTGMRVAGSAEPEVVSLDRRLRLKPKEAMTVEVWADIGQTGGLLDIDCEVPVTLRWRTILGFDIDEQGQYTLGSSSLDHQTDLASRSRLESLGDNAEDVALMIELAEPGEPLLLTLMQARSLLLLTIGSNAGDAEEVKNDVCEVIAERFVSMSPIERAFTLIMMPPAQSIPPAQLVDDAAADDTDRYVTIMRLRRIQDPEDEQFTLAMQSDDPVVQNLATLLHHRVARLKRINEGFTDANTEADAGQ